jgi:hypothetical protein
MEDGEEGRDGDGQRQRKGGEGGTEEKEVTQKDKRGRDRDLCVGG